MSMRATLLALLTILTPAAAFAAPEAPPPPKPLFASRDVIHLTVKGPLVAIAASAARDADPVAASLAVGDGETLPITLEVRGITRRKRETCSFPPLRIAFTDKPGAASLFKGQKKLKLVTHCRPAPDFQQNVLLEYAAYRMANVLSPLSFKARLASIDYVDTDGHSSFSRLGFLLEDTDDMAKRNGLHEADAPDRIPPGQLNARDAGREAVFQYMIGNLDWAMTAGPPGEPCCHNSKLIAPQGATSGFTPVPYDFDFSGLVDAVYAVPPDSIQVASVRVRRYRGYCRHNAEAQVAAADIRAHRAQILAVLDELPQLDDVKRRKAAAYLDSFFSQIGSDKDVAANLLRNCL